MKCMRDIFFPCNKFPVVSPTNRVPKYPEQFGTVPEKVILDEVVSSNRIISQTPGLFYQEKGNYTKEHHFYRNREQSATNWSTTTFFFTYVKPLIVSGWVPMF